MAIDGWNTLTSSSATNRTLRTLRATVGTGGSWNGQLVLSKKYLQLFRPGFIHKAVSGGRGTAKTTSIALYIILRMDAAYTVVAGLRKRQVSIKHTSRQALLKAIRLLGLGHRFEQLQNEIRHRVTGSFAFFQGLEHESDESTRGLDGVDIFWIDEARNVAHRDLMNVVRVIRERGAELITSWNPLDPEDAIERLYNGEMPPQSLLKIVTSQEDNPLFFASPMADEYWRLKAEDEQMWLHVYGGAYDIAGGERIYDNIQIGVPPDQFFEDAVPVYGMDIGYSDDPSVVTKTWVSDTFKRAFVEKEAVGYGEDVDGICDLLDAVLDGKDDLVTCDNSEPRTTAAVNALGYNLLKTKKNEIGVVEGIREVRSLRPIVHPSCTETIDESKHYKWKVDRQSGKRTQVPRKGHDHCWDSIRYAVLGRDAAAGNEVGIFRVQGF
jgi:phage terminase large subunit